MAIREVNKWIYGVRTNKSPLRYYETMLLTGSVLWDYVIEWVCETKSGAPNYYIYWNGHTHLEAIEVETPGISEYLDFGPYYWVVFRSNLCMRKVEIGICIEVTHQVRQLMSYQVLTESGRWGPSQDAPFYRRALIWVNYKIVIQLSQQIFFPFHI